MEVLLLPFAVAILTWLIVSPIVFLYWWVKPQSRAKFMSSHDAIGAAICVGAFLSCVVVLSECLKGILVFLPESWGVYDEEGEFIPAGYSLAPGIAFLLTVGLACVHKDLPKIRALAPKEVRTALGVLDRVDTHRVDFGAFRMVSDEIEGWILSHRREFLAFVRKGNSIRAWVYTSIANTARDLLKSGQYRNPMGVGGELLRLFDTASDELVRMGHRDTGCAETQKRAVRENIDWPDSQSSRGWLRQWGISVFPERSTEPRS